MKTAEEIRAYQAERASQIDAAWLADRLLAAEACILHAADTRKTQCSIHVEETASLQSVLELMRRLTALGYKVSQPSRHYIRIDW